MDTKDKPKDQPGTAESSSGGAPVIKSSTGAAEAPAAGAGGAQAPGAGAGADDVELVLTLSGTTGELLKIEKITDRAQGKREPLTEQESADVFGLDTSGAADYYDPYSDPYSGYDPSAEAAYYYAMDPYGYAAAYGDPYADESAYAEGGEGSVAEQLVAAGYEPAVAAYYQGIADFMAYGGE